MKRIAVMFALLFMFGSSFISCRETNREADDAEVRVEEVGEDLEDTGEEIENEID